MWREDDKVTRWIHKYWLEEFAHVPELLPMAAAVARMVNWTDTLHVLGFPISGWTDEYEAHFLEVFAERRAKGLKSWTSAYMITGGFSAGGESKEAIIARVLRQLQNKLYSNPLVNGDTLATAAEKLKSPGIGSFLSAQIVADLKHFEPLYYASDWKTWCAPGPGSTAGLNFLFDRPAKEIPADQFRAEINQVREVLKDSIDLDAQNVQNCMCEFSKYYRTKYKGGKPKAKYVQAIQHPTRS